MTREDEEEEEKEKRRKKEASENEGKREEKDTHPAVSHSTMTLSRGHVEYKNTHDQQSALRISITSNNEYLNS